MCQSGKNFSKMKDIPDAIPYSGLLYISVVAEMGAVENRRI